MKKVFLYSISSWWFISDFFIFLGDNRKKSLVAKSISGIMQTDEIRGRCVDLFFFDGEAGIASIIPYSYIMYTLQCVYRKS